MKQRSLQTILVSLFLMGFLFSPFFITAKENSWPLSNKQTQSLLDIMRKGPLTEAQRDYYNASLYYQDSSYPRKTGAVVLTKQTILKKQLNYWLKGTPIELSKSFIKITFRVISLLDGGGVAIAIDLIERTTVKKATAYAMNWFLQNEIRVGTGQGDYIFQSYKNNWQQIIIPHIIVYNPNEHSVVAEFYSNNAFEPPRSRGGWGGPEAATDWPGSTPWPQDRWIINEKTRNNDGKLEPFIIRIKGFVTENKHGLFSWDKTKPKPTIEVSFDEPVPEIKQGDIIWTSQISMKINFIKNKIRNSSLGDILDLRDKVTKVTESITKVVSGIKKILNGGDPTTYIITQVKKEEIEKTKEEFIPETIEKTEITKEVKKIEVEIIEPIITPKIKKEKLEEEVVVEKEIIEEVVEIKIVKAKIIEEIEPKIEKPASCSVPNNSTPTRNNIIINELAWMGTINSSNDEWIELKNISSNSINLKNWQIIDKKEQIKIILEDKTLPQGNFFLLERTDDTSVTNVTADLIYTGNINNTKEELYLFDQKCILQDKITANPYWPDGDNSTKRTLERKSNLEWQTSKDVGGTPKKENSSGKIQTPGGSTTLKRQATQPEPEKIATTTEELVIEIVPLNIIITEIQIGTASSSKEDFIELFNLATTSADISGMKLRKKSSTGKEYSIKTIPQNSIIKPNDYFLWANSEYTSIEPNTTSTQTLSKNNSVALLDKDNNIIDQVAWGESVDPFTETESFPNNPTGNQTLGRKWNNTYQDTNNNKEDFEIQIPTPKALNSPFIEETISLLPSPIVTLTAAPSAIRKAIDLFWTATTSKKYILKKAEKEIVEESTITNKISFNEATSIDVTESSGDIQHILLENLNPEIIYYFALKFINEEGITSTISNLAKAKPQKGFRDNEDNTITDLHTGLMWPKDGNSTISSNGTTSTQYESSFFISTSTFAGYSDWRLPNLKELVSLLTYKETFNNLFINIKDNYWSSDKYRSYASGFPGDPSTYFGWYVDLQRGTIQKIDFENNNSPKYLSLPVRGTEIQDIKTRSDLTNNEDGTITDNDTNLMWANSSLAQVKDSRKPWNRAMKFAQNRVLCKDNAFLGDRKTTNDCSLNGGIKYDDWRLPNVQEIIRIIRMNSSLILSWPGSTSFYWTQSISSNEKVWSVGDGLLIGQVLEKDKTKYLNIQIVRDIF